MAEEKRPGLACLITGVMTWVILLIFKMLAPGYVPRLVIFLPIFTVVMLIISLVNRKEIAAAVIGFLLGGSALLWYFLS